MEVWEAIEKRVSVRRFSTRDVPEEVVDRVLEAGCRAPTAGNLQPWRFWVVRKQEIKEELAEAAWGQMFVSEAPVVIVCCVDLDACAHGYGSRGETLYGIQDTAAAIENMILTATSEGWGTCWVGAFSEEAARRVLELPPGIRPVALVVIGEPEGGHHSPGRYEFRKFTTYV